jgi:MFS family permease
MKKPLYYGWILVYTLSITQTVSWGILYYAFTVFIVPMEKELGWTRAELSGAFSLSLVIGGVSGLFVGRWLDKHGSRLLMTGGSVLATLLVAAWAVVDNLLNFYLIWVGLGLAASAVLYEPAFAVITVWFRQKRGRALTVLTFIAGFASVIFLPLTEWLVSSFGWRNALWVLAGGLAIITIPLHALVLRRNPEDMGFLPDGEPLADGNPTLPPEISLSMREARRESVFWWLTLSFSLNMLIVVSISVHLVPYLQDSKFDSGFAAAAVGFIGVMAMPGRLIFNLLAERFPRTLLTSLIFTSQTISLLFLLLIPGAAGVWLFVIFYGAGFGAITPMRAGLVAELYGRKFYATISGVLTLFTTVARAFGPLGTGIAYDITGSYIPVFWFLTVVSVLAVFTVLGIKLKNT